MAINQVMSGADPIESMQEGDIKLREIVVEIHEYLNGFEGNGFWSIVGKFYYQKCCRSWLRVNTHLDKFLLDPKANYSLLMIILENEMEKFPSFLFYGKQLQSLSRLVAMGPSFTQQG